jgi:transposase-like protein
LDVVASAVNQVEVSGSTLTEAAAEHHCSRRSVRRWIRWISGLVDARLLEQFCSRADLDGRLPAGRRDRGAASILSLLEQAADALFDRGVSLARRGAGLSRVLCDRVARFGEVFFLTKSSPPLLADLAGVRI